MTNSCVTEYNSNNCCSNGKRSFKLRIGRQKKIFRVSDSRICLLIFYKLKKITKNEARQKVMLDILKKLAIYYQASPCILWNFFITVCIYNFLSKSPTPSLRKDFPIKFMISKKSQLKNAFYHEDNFNQDETKLQEVPLNIFIPDIDEKIKILSSTNLCVFPWKLHFCQPLQFLIGRFTFHFG